MDTSLYMPTTRNSAEQAELEMLDRIIKKERSQKLKRTLTALSLLLPSLFFLGVFTIYPIMKSIYGSLFVDNLSVMEPVWNGLGNYIDLFSDTVFRECFVNNLLVAVVTIPVSIAVAVGAATLSENLKHGKTLVRLAFIYTPIYGLLGYINPNWRILSSSDTALWGIMIMLIWKQAGYIMLFYIAGLQGIDKEALESAKIDGATLLKPAYLCFGMISVSFQWNNFL